jgi:hypothetical protein
VDATGDEHPVWEPFNDAAHRIVHCYLDHLALPKSPKKIAKALLSYDLPQIEYYGLRTKRMVGDVLIKNGVVEWNKEGKSIYIDLDVCQ